ncbi:MAG: hypothetical protein LBH58_12095 [Tannerellaceae bacterium]|jgi:hypothetical protein|nr:hypothetical protein [Tannerellaceae bacterium]
MKKFIFLLFVLLCSVTVANADILINKSNPYEDPITLTRNGSYAVAKFELIDFNIPSGCEIQWVIGGGYAHLDPYGGGYNPTWIQFYDAGTYYVSAYIYNPTTGSRSYCSSANLIVL